MDEFDFYDPYDKEIIAIQEKHNKIKSKLKSIKLDFGKYKDYDLWHMINYPRTGRNDIFIDYLNWAARNTDQLKVIILSMPDEVKKYFLDSIKKYPYESFKLK